MRVGVWDERSFSFPLLGLVGGLRVAGLGVVWVQEYLLICWLLLTGFYVRYKVRSCWCIVYVRSVGCGMIRWDDSI